MPFAQVCLCLPSPYFVLITACMFYLACRLTNTILIGGKLVIGPPGSGKTTYCHGMHQFLTAIGRKVSIVNLDPANDHIPYPCAVDIADLITLEDTMETLGLGPNGGMMYCMEFLQKNFDWLLEKLKELGAVEVCAVYVSRVKVTHRTRLFSTPLLQLRRLRHLRLPRPGRALHAPQCRQGYHRAAAEARLPARGCPPR
ncbi:hypothetical protein BC938DRAFT_481466 [Jimgerdemannia flammicorona]|uniref:GPN-loop GTPase 2 n=1 Tax=Jimgerdemannia flammicorona TaxID=994334 RepID=A0A433QG16_9FUNG|nr:hypothetical protein BC938DRAFT_481466 [Jimgerdemannia flammicorona]